MNKRIVLRLINLLWYGTAAAIISFAVLVSIGREVLPRVDLANDKFLRYINDLTGARIHASQLEVRWTSIYPEIRAQQFVIDTADAHVELNQVFFTINLFQSLWQRTPVIDRMQLERANIRVTLPEDTNTPLDFERDWRFINRLFNNDTQIQNIVVELQRGDWKKTIEIDDFRVEKTLLNKKFSLKLLGTDEQTLSAIGKFSGDSLRDSNGEIYLKTKNLALNDWNQTPTKNSTVNGEVWLQWQGLQQIDFTSQLTLLTPAESRTDSEADSEIMLPPAVTGTFSGQWRKQQASYIDVHALALTDKPLLENLRLSFNTAKPQQWKIATPALLLDNTLTLLPFLPEGELKHLFSSLNLHGYLRNVELTWDNSKPLTERMQIQANADNISSGHWEGVPAFTGVSGYVRSGIGYGFIDLNSNNGFSMHYPEVYHKPIVFQRAAGRVQWQWTPEQQTVFVGSDYASLSGDPGEARGSFWLHLPLHDADFHSELYLSIGLRNSTAQYRNMFIPYILPKDLLVWLDTSIGDADLPAAGFLYRGGLTDTEATESAVQFFGDIRNGDLKFQPDWPPLQNIDARLLVDNHNAYIRADRATLYDTAIDAAHIAVLQQQPGLTININGRAHGSPDDGLRLLRESPLHHAIGSGMDSWKMPQGALETALQLQIPLSGATLPQTENVQLKLSNAQLNMQDLRLPFHQVSSNLSYDSDNGLQAPSIKATLFNKPVTANIVSKQSAQGSIIQVSTDSSANISDIASWSMITPLKLLSGTADYHIQLQLGPFGKTQVAQLGQLQVSSTLDHIAAPLPAPFNKRSNTKTPFNLTVDLLNNNQQTYRFNYNQQVFGTLAARNGALTGGDIQLLGSQTTPTNVDGKLFIHGNLETVDIQQWIDLIVSHNQLSSDTSGNSTNSLLPSVAISAQQASWKDFSFSNLAINADHNDGAWLLAFNTQAAQGKALFYDTGKTPDIIIDTLNAARQNSMPKTKSPAGNVDFSAIPALNISIQHLLVDEMDIGNFSTALRSTANSLRFEKLMATGSGYLLRDGSGLGGSTLLWQQKSDGSYHSEFHGALHMSGEQPVLKHLGIDPFIIGKRVSLFADLTWPGTPQGISLHTIAGTIYTEGKDGKYLQAQPNIAMHALSVVNITTWLRRLQLDFSDLSNNGISFDEYKGKLLFGNGMMQFVEPLEIESPSSAFKLSGKALLDSDTLDLRLIATLPVGNNATWVAALAGGLPAAAGVYVASKIFDKQISSLSSLSYRITGPMNDPVMSFERIAPPVEKNKEKPQTPTTQKPTTQTPTKNGATKSF
ncbi:MAG: DUF3971 domain-containing protein [Pseudomonadales bacterium]